MRLLHGWREQQAFIHIIQLYEQNNDDQEKNERRDAYRDRGKRIINHNAAAAAAVASDHGNESI